MYGLCNLPLFIAENSTVTHDLLTLESQIYMPCRIRCLKARTQQNVTAIPSSTASRAGRALCLFFILQRRRRVVLRFACTCAQILPFIFMHDTEMRFHL